MALSCAGPPAAATALVPCESCLLAMPVAYCACRPAFTACWPHTQSLHRVAVESWSAERLQPGAGAALKVRPAEAGALSGQRRPSWTPLYNQRVCLCVIDGCARAVVVSAQRFDGIRARHAKKEPSTQEAAADSEAASGHENGVYCVILEQTSIFALACDETACSPEAMHYAARGIPQFLPLSA